MKMKKKELLSSLTPFRGMRPHGPPSPFDTLHSSFVLRGKHQEKAIHLLLPESSALPVPSSWSPAFFVLFCYFGVCVGGGGCCITQPVGSQFPDWRSNLGPWQWEQDVLTAEPPGNPHLWSFMCKNSRLDSAPSWGMMRTSVLCLCETKPDNWQWAWASRRSFGFASVIRLWGGQTQNKVITKGLRSIHLAGVFGLGHYHSPWP